MPAKAGRTGNLFPDAMVNIKSATNKPSARRRTHNLVKTAGIFMLFMRSFFLSHETPLMAVWMGQIHPQ